METKWFELKVRITEEELDVIKSVLNRISDDIEFGKALRLDEIYDHDTDTYKKVVNGKIVDYGDYDI